MKRLITLSVLISLFSPISAQNIFAPFTSKKEKTVGKPKLVIGIVVDQMRWDYLYRYYDEYGKDGFRRLLSDGFACQQTFINYLPSYTAPGHSAIYTGSVPAIHGITGNDWVDNNTGTYHYCTSDSSVSPVGGSQSFWGKMSPANLLTSTITDELRLATNMRSRVYGISLKDRGSVIPAGHIANGAFWFDDSTGNFMTSSYYNNILPSWMQYFNSRRLADTLLRTPWRLDPSMVYKYSLLDDNAYEGQLPGEKTASFPHLATAGAPYTYNTLRYTPWGNTLTFEAAKACINGEKLGQTDVTDFLCLSFSSTDYVGHLYGPNALETEDTYLRLDRELGLFLKYLDEKVGAGNYVLFLTADHGAAHNSLYMNSVNVPAGNNSFYGAVKELNAMLKKRYATDSLVLSLENYQVYLNEKKLAKTRVKRAELKERIAAWMTERKGTAYVIDLENLDRVVLPEPLKSMVINGYHKDRSGCLQLVMQPGWYDGYAATGTTHGTWNPYDTHIPLLWYGWNIPRGESNAQASITDIAPTLAALLHIQMPNGCVGKAIKAVLNTK